MTERYNFKKSEAKWQKIWRREGVYEPDLKKPKKPFYNLMMFPYPSAEGLHVGNVYAFTGADIYGRMKRMQGYDVFEPIGLDGFGIHSENYALKIGAHPMRQAKVSEKRFYKQLGAIGNGFAWNERLETYDPSYYKWTQWIFTQMFKYGLAYRKKQPVNWCRSCKTVLADEQVVQISNIKYQKSKSQIKNEKLEEIKIGVCERCETPVIKKELEQWFFGITKYANRLLKNIDTLDWSEKVKIAQRNWIGKSEGAEIEFRMKNLEYSIKVFTTRPDTIFGATYMVLAPEYSLIEELKPQIINWPAVAAYIKKARSKSDEERLGDGKEKTGVELQGLSAVNPATGKNIPMWVADYVLATYGTGAIMAVPAHDERDFEFAKKFKLPIKYVIEPWYTQIYEPGAYREGEPVVPRDAIIAIIKHWSEDKYISLRWKNVAWRTFLTGGIKKGQSSEVAGIAEIREETGYLHPKFIRELGRVHGLFYHVIKKENRLGHSHILYFELQDDAQRVVSEKETAMHSVEWLTLSELEKILTAQTHQYALALFRGDPVIHTGNGILMNSGTFSGMDSEVAKWEIVEAIAGKRTSQYRLRDWLISRQRYWGPPIPMIFCEHCKKSLENSKLETRNSKPSPGELQNPGWHPVPEKNLPVRLPFVKDFRPRGTGVAPLASVKSFYETKCPACKGKARRETDVSDTFLDSAWYYLGYLMQNGKIKNQNDKLKLKNGKIKFPWNRKLVKCWLPVTSYIGGAEHSVLHLLYARFMAMAMKDWGLLHFEEPFTKFRAHGLVIKDGAKMSKSKGNVVNPDAYVKKFGADVLRTYLMFVAPFEQGGDFRDAGIVGVERFLTRVRKLMENVNIKNENDNVKSKNEALERKLHQTIKKVTEDIENLRYNTAVSALMILLNEFETTGTPQLPITYLQNFLKLLAPFAPHMTEELWQEIYANQRTHPRGSALRSIHHEPWPSYNPKLIEEKRYTLIIQVNGRVRDRVEVPKEMRENDVTKMALERGRVQEFIRGAKPKKVIYIPGRLVNIVL